MRPIGIAVFLFCAALLPRQATASIATYSASSQSVTLTGLGGNAQGLGQSRVTWGTCAFDGTNTKCTVSAPFTGVGGGGTLTALLTYPGNGASPLTAISISPGNNLVNLNLSAGSFVVILAENNGTTTTFAPDTFTFFYSAPSCTGVGSCGVGQVGLTPGATITGPVNGQFDPSPVIRTSVGVITASAYGGFTAVAPGSWMEIYGANLASVASQTWSGGDFKGNLAPTALGGTTVTIGGQPAFIDYVSPTQVNAQVPSNVAPGSQPVVVTTTVGGNSLPHQITVNVTEPGLLAPSVFNLSTGQNVVAVFPSNDPNALTYVLPPNLIPGVATSRARPGDTIIFYGVGFGPVTPDIPAGQIVTASNKLAATASVTFAGTQATMTFAGLVGGFLGLYQFNVVVPQVPASDSTPVVFSLNGTPGPQHLVIAIGN